MKSKKYCDFFFSPISREKEQAQSILGFNLERIEQATLTKVRNLSIYVSSKTDPAPFRTRRLRSKEKVNGG